jgi:tRNA nucleotidyltransferase (CCA-adding enzyme)
VKIYQVGGSLRDELLGLPVQDRDWVVVGSSAEEMVALGYKPVGRDFPVFLHPETHEEYALARTERKVAAGYHGFHFYADPSVTLEQDLLRRDLTINAMARDPRGHWHDPFHGIADLEDRLLRHVSAAFEEDPVRILRVARFAARFKSRDFTVAPETMSLMQNMVNLGEADALVAERVVQEFNKGLMEAAPSEMLGVLRQCHALSRVLPEVDVRLNQDTLLMLDRAAQMQCSLESRWSLLLYRTFELNPDKLEAFCHRLRLPDSHYQMALLEIRFSEPWVQLQAGNALPAETLLEMLERMDALRRPERFSAILDALTAAHPGEVAGPRLLDSLKKIAAIKMEAQWKGLGPQEIAAKIRAARLEQLRG